MTRPSRSRFLQQLGDRLRVVEDVDRGGERSVILDRTARREGARLLGSAPGFVGGGEDQQHGLAGQVDDERAQEGKPQEESGLQAITPEDYEELNIAVARSGSFTRPACRR